MTVGYKLTTRNGRLDFVDTEVGASGFLLIYDGTRPTDVETAKSANTQLAKLPLSATAFAAAAAGAMASNTITDATGDADGTPTGGSVETSAGVRVVDLTAAVGSGDLNFSAGITTGATVSCPAGLTLTDGSV